jgi:hypothetical protein
VITFRRQKLGTVPELRAFGPRSEVYPHDGCPACGRLFAVGDYTTLIPLGPGDSEEARQKARERRWFNSVAVEVHYVCATGSPACVDDVTRGIEQESTS